MSKLENMTKAELMAYIEAQEAEKTALAEKANELEAKNEALEAEVNAADEKDEVIPEAVDRAPENTREWLNERVPFYAFKDSDRYKDDIVVGINGKNFIIQRGKQVMIPRYVKIHIDSSMAQEAIAADVIAGFQEQQEMRAKEFGL